MIKFENTEVFGFEHAIRGMRNPMNSWNKSDSEYVDYDICPKFFKVEENDLDLMKRLIKAGPVHSKFMRMIVVYADITAPLYWWKEFDTYKVGTVANSCSTMHKIHSKEFEISDFSYEHLLDDTNIEDWAEITDEDGYMLNTDGRTCLEQTIKVLNEYRDKYLETKDKKYWWQMIQLLPSSYNQKRTVMLNYEVLRNIYKPDCRLHHKLDEWNVNCDGSFCQLIETLPYSELITQGEK